MSLSSDMQAALAELDACDVPTVLHHLLPRRNVMEATIQAMYAALKTLLERSAPRSPCAGAKLRRVPHRCLKPEHGDDCLVKYGSCGLGHNSLLCTHRRPIHPKIPRN
ncbi:hypothetical protein Q1695_009667 [Nippostrongylus brasiliensis]|nr:hypothetical protein Q1695_009667 [Nippostrongylus brasiliensis]